MKKYDVKKAPKPLYAATAREFTLVDVPPAQYLGIDGHGNPNTATSYVRAVEALYSLSYAVKFHSKKELGRDYVVALSEGLCVQTLHLGPYSDEGPVLARLHGEYMPANGLDFNGRHHEIYLGDPRRVAPEKLRTILRQPVVAVGGATGRGAANGNAG